MTDDGWYKKHPLLLGKLSGNLLTIEISARICIELRMGKTMEDIQNRLFGFQEGQMVDITPLSDPEGMTWTLDEYNKCVEQKEPELMVARKEIVDLRDALAHGKAFGVAVNGVLHHHRLIKLGRRADKKATQVPVTLRVEMTEQWFNEKAEFLTAEMGKIQKAMEWDQKHLGDY